MPPPTPGAPQVDKAGYNSAALSWRKVQNVTQGNQGKVSYTVFRNGVSILDTFDNDIVDNGLIDGTTYSYALVARDQSGTSGLSPAGVITLPKIVTYLVGTTILTGPGNPTNVVAAAPGTLWLRTDGGAGSTFYVKETGTGTSGWAAK